MKYFLVLFLCLTISCADDVKKKTVTDLPDMGMDSAIDLVDTPDQPVDTPDQPVDTPDLPIDTPDLPPDMPTNPSDGPIKVSTWNILCLREDADAAFCNTDDFGNEYIRSPQQVAALRQHAEALGTDILFLQEVESLAAVKNLLPGWEVFDAGSSGQKLAVAVPPSSPIQIREVTVLSELDLGSSQLRPGLVARVDHAGVSVRILAVHLKSGCQIAPFDTNNTNCGALRQQLEVLKDWIRAREAQNQPYMMVGDFNRTLEDNDPFYLGLEDAAGKPLYRSTVGARPDCWDHLPEAPSYPSFIDHHIVSPSVVTAWGTPTLNIYDYTETYAEAWMYVSDHCAITVSFE